MCRTLNFFNYLLDIMDALLSMPWLYETLTEDRAAEEAAAAASMEETKEQEAMQTGRL